MMQPATLTIRHDAFLVLGARGIEGGCDHRIKRIENLLGIDAEHVAPVLAAAHVETRRHVAARIRRGFLQRCEKGSFEIVILSLKGLRILLLSESLRQDDCVLESTERPEIMAGYVTGHILVVARGSRR